MKVCLIKPLSKDSWLLRESCNNVNRFLKKLCSPLTIYKDFSINIKEDKKSDEYFKIILKYVDSVFPRVTISFCFFETGGDIRIKVKVNKFISKEYEPVYDHHTDDYKKGDEKKKAYGFEKTYNEVNETIISLIENKSFFSGRDYKWKMVFIRKEIKENKNSWTCEYHGIPKPTRYGFGPNDNGWEMVNKTLR